MILLRAGDLIIYRGLDGWGILKPVAKWLLGTEWSHAGLFFLWTKHGLPLTIESIGRGVMIRSMLNYKGRYAKVLRWKEENAELVSSLVAKAAERLADNPSSWYDYWAIPRYVLPRMIWLRLTGKRRGFGYRNNPFFICSELVSQAYKNAGYPIFENDVIPLPQDFAESDKLKTVWEGVLKF